MQGAEKKSRKLLSLKKNGKPIFKYRFNNELAEIINSIFEEYKRIYGYPRIKIELKKSYNIFVSKKIIYKYMKILGISSFVRKKQNEDLKRLKLLIKNIKMLLKKVE